MDKAGTAPPTYGIDAGAPVKYARLASEEAHPAGRQGVPDGTTDEARLRSRLVDNSAMCIVLAAGSLF